MLNNICNMCGWDLPDMSALALGRCAPSGSCVHIRQIPPAHVTYITCALMMASGPCNNGSVFPHFAEDVSNLVIDGDYMLKKKEDTKGSRAWQQFQNVLVSWRPTRIVFYPVNTE